MSGLILKSNLPTGTQLPPTQVVGASMQKHCNCATEAQGKNQQSK